MAVLKAIVFEKSTWLVENQPGACCVCPQTYRVDAAMRPPQT
ncbi:hypothetical protein [Schaedlerella arabinosiphila]|nr:hypothetical protein [Schaedlerella arabinosiphila]